MSDVILKMKMSAISAGKLFQRACYLESQVDHLNAQLEGIRAAAMAIVKDAPSYGPLWFGSEEIKALHPFLKPVDQVEVYHVDDPVGYVSKRMLDQMDANAWSGLMMRSQMIDGDIGLYTHSVSRSEIPNNSDHLTDAGEMNASADVPDGWKLVPLEPTLKMLEEIHLVKEFTHQAMTARYVALLDAAPEPPKRELRT